MINYTNNHMVVFTPVYGWSQNYYILEINAIVFTR